MPARRPVSQPIRPPLCGRRAGGGIRQGLSEKAPEVQAQGQSILQSLIQLFSSGIMVPIHLKQDDNAGAVAAGIVQKASLGAGRGAAPGPSVPDAPAAGVGRSRDDIGSHVAAFGEHVDRLADASIHSQLSVTVSGSGTDGVRVTGMRTRATGPISADMGVSMPGAKDDWA